MGKQVKEGKVHLLEALEPHLGKICSTTLLFITKVNVQLKYVDTPCQHRSDYSFKQFTKMRGTVILNLNSEFTSEINAEKFCDGSEERMLP